jgi:hypothetical protein
MRILSLSNRPRHPRQPFNQKPGSQIPPDEVTGLNCSIELPRLAVVSILLDSFSREIGFVSFVDYDLPYRSLQNEETSQAVLPREEKIM